MAQAKPVKILVLFSNQESHWGSCNSISGNLRLAYASLGPKFQVIWQPIDQQASQTDTRYGGGYYIGLARSIYASGAQKIVALDHNLDLVPLLLALKSVDARKYSRLHFSFHVYGDFNLYAKLWQNIGWEVEGCFVSLVCASERQMQMVQYFEKEEGHTNTAVCPFPVDARYFKFEPFLRSRWRAKLHIARQHLILYSGRLSLQKGILPLIEEFRHQLENGADAVLAIAGECDDIGSPTTGMHLPHGYFFHRLNEALQALPPPVRERVILLGKLPKEDLRGVYSAADSFVSLSLYHDEDFGMAPAEAICTGLPALLTDWGGYSSFAVPAVPVSLVRVGLSERGLAIDYSDLRDKWKKILNGPVDPEGRPATARAFAKNFSVAAVAARLRALHARTPARFPAFSWRISAPRSTKALREGLYRDIYSNYVAKEARP